MTVATMFVVAIVSAGCSDNPARSGALLTVGSDQNVDAPLRTGAEILSSTGFEVWKGLKVGLIVNHTSRVGERHLIDLVHDAPGVEVAVLFGPEHGLRGQAGAGEAISDAVDSLSGAPVFSLYGQIRRPTPAMLADVDALIFDIQDIGARFYTYISTMGLAMQSAAEVGIPFYVLDRPNPLGGEAIAGFIRDSDHESFVGQYPIPVQHGLTVGELARMIQGHAWLPGLENLELHVVSMTGWNRRMLWPDTGLDWIPPSPNIPTFETALLYPGTCFFEATSASEGRGTPSPFLTIGAPWLNADSLVDELAHKGVSFRAGRAVPQSIPGVAPSPKLESTAIETIDIHVTDPHAVQSMEIGMDALVRMRNSAPDSIRSAFINERWLGLLSGSDSTWTMIQNGKSGSEIAQAWESDVTFFREQRHPWLLYD